MAKKKSSPKVKKAPAPKKVAAAKPPATTVSLPVGGDEGCAWTSCCNTMRGYLGCTGAPIVDLASRLFVANSFVANGVNLYNTHWQGTVFDTAKLYETLQPYAFATSGNSTLALILLETVFAAFLALGFKTRLSALVLGLFAVATLMSVTATTSLMWATLLLLLVSLTKGAGKFSLDKLWCSSSCTMGSCSK